MHPSATAASSFPLDCQPARTRPRRARPTTQLLHHGTDTDAVKLLWLHAVHPAALANHPDDVADVVPLATRADFGRHGHSRPADGFPSPTCASVDSLARRLTASPPESLQRLTVPVRTASLVVTVSARPRALQTRRYRHAIVFAPSVDTVITTAGRRGPPRRRRRSPRHAQSSARSHSGPDGCTSRTVSRARGGVAQVVLQEGRAACPPACELGQLT